METVYELDLWMQATKKYMIHYCAYGTPYKKPTHIWTTLTDWEPRGKTGSGLCEGKCGQLEEAVNHGKERKRERHQCCIEGAADRAIHGPGKKQQLWSLPELLQQELMEEIELKHPEKKFIFDLFSGGESWRNSVQKAGYSYVPVDLRRSLAKAS
jgi:hypothetical protein